MMRLLSTKQILHALTVRTRRANDEHSNLHRTAFKTEPSKCQEMMLHLSSSVTSFGKRYKKSLEVVQPDRMSSAIATLQAT